MSVDSAKIVIEPDDDFPERREAGEGTFFRALSFRLGGERYAVDMRDVRSAVRLGEWTRVPNTPHFVEGVMNLRGEIVPVLNIGHFFGLPRKEPAKDMMVIVTDAGGSTMAFTTEGLDESLEISEADIQPPLGTILKELMGFTKGQVQLEKDIVILLDLRRILGCVEIEKLKKGETT